jgi:hypothetical protein
MFFFARYRCSKLSGVVLTANSLQSWKAQSFRCLFGRDATEFVIACRQGVLRQPSEGHFTFQGGLASAQRAEGAILPRCLDLLTSGATAHSVAEKPSDPWEGP